MKKLSVAAFAALFALVLAGCGGGGDDGRVVTGPGFVGIDDSVDATAPQLTVTFHVPPSQVIQTAVILSDRPSDGDIEFRPVTSDFVITTNATTVFFGDDSLSAGPPEFRAFLTIPLDGLGGRDVVPGNAIIDSASLEVFIDQVSFASVIPTFLDLVQYPPAALDPADFSSAPLAFRTLDFLFGDQGNFVAIDVFTLMETAQVQGLLDFQVRFSLDRTAPLGASVARPNAAVRTVVPPPRANRGTLQRGPSAPLTPEEQKSRHR